MGWVLLIVYSAWALYTGYQWSSEKLSSLSDKGILGRIFQIFIGLMVGYFYGGIKLVLMALSFVFNFVSM